MGKEIELYVGGARRPGARRMDVVEPAKGAVALTLHVPDAREIDDAVKTAAAAFVKWGDTPAHARADVLGKLAREVEAAKPRFVEAMIAATGKTRRDASGEVDRSVDTLALSSEETRRIEGFEVPMEGLSRGVGRIAIMRRYPIGVVAAITPFNAPLNTACHKIAPALGAGNTVVHKPDVRGGEVAVMLAELATKAGLPPGVLNVIHGDADVGEPLVRNPLVEVVGFTGSEAIGERILGIAGLKRVLLELGGNAPAIIHHDADLGRALKDLVPASFGMSGQSCISTQRIYVHQSLYEAFVAGLVKGAGAMKVGEPSDPDVEIGPMITEEAAKRVESWIRDAVSQGARLRCGGERRGAIVTPAVLTDVKPEMTVVCKEVFGPVVSVMPYDDVDAVIAQANATPYGLQAGLYTNSLDLMLKCARRLRFGGVNVNAPSRWRLDNMPYGGVKRSGIGREGPKYAIEDMSELRQLVIG
ncbi:MAG: aldehyde dehydrogenase family protein [Burkholderiales bacterium]